MRQNTSIYAKHIDENNFALGQNGFKVISGSAFVTQSNNDFCWYWIYAVTNSFVCAESYLGDDLVFTQSFATAATSSRTIPMYTGQSIYGCFSKISQSSGMCLAYRG